MTVKELIEALKDIPPDTPVMYAMLNERRFVDGVYFDDGDDAVELAGDEE